jgi:hypothetical protein
MSGLVLSVLRQRGGVSAEAVLLWDEVGTRVRGVSCPGARCASVRGRRVTCCGARAFGAERVVGTRIPRDGADRPASVRPLVGGTTDRG